MITALISRPLIVVAALMTTGTAGLAGIAATPAGAHLIGHAPSASSPASPSSPASTASTASASRPGRSSDRDSGRDSGRGQCQPGYDRTHGRCDAALLEGPALSGPANSGPGVTAGLNFSDADITTARDYTVTLTWGDGSHTKGFVTGDTHSWVAQGSHVFAKAGTYSVEIWIAPKDGGTPVGYDFQVTQAGGRTSGR